MEQRLNNILNMFEQLRGHKITSGTCKADIVYKIQKGESDDDILAELIADYRRFETSDFQEKFNQTLTFLYQSLCAKNY